MKSFIILAGIMGLSSSFASDLGFESNLSGYYYNDDKFIDFARDSCIFKGFSDKNLTYVGTCLYNNNTNTLFYLSQSGNYSYTIYFDNNYMTLINHGDRLSFIANNNIDQNGPLKFLQQICLKAGP